jgi:hypothetical protein
MIMFAVRLYLRDTVLLFRSASEHFTRAALASTWVDPVTRGTKTLENLAYRMASSWLWTWYIALARVIYDLFV